MKHSRPFELPLLRVRCLDLYLIFYLGYLFSWHLVFEFFIYILVLSPPLAVKLVRHLSVFSRLPLCMTVSMLLRFMRSHYIYYLFVCLFILVNWWIFIGVTNRNVCDRTKMTHKSSCTTTKAHLQHRRQLRRAEWSSGTPHSLQAGSSPESPPPAAVYPVLKYCRMDFENQKFSLSQTCAILSIS